MKGLVNAVAECMGNHLDPFPPLSVQIAKTVASFVKQDLYPHDALHGQFAAYVLEYFVHLSNLTNKGDIKLDHNAERKFIIEHLAVTFAALERIFGVAQVLWQSTTIKAANFNAQTRVVDAFSQIHYVLDPVALTTSRPDRTFDIIVRANATFGDFLLVDFSGSPKILQHTDHPRDGCSLCCNAINLDNEARSLLKGRLLRFADSPWSDLTIAWKGGWMKV
ncbi:hypothetical protein HDU85_003963 [Gaertneriomyces sp. JEL0708]|nr:hypothetical protein HDU85_003963 [Gaertneriomyces sp. JEL0708]